MLQRFLEAQDNGIYERALAEIKAGQKQSHWMWFIFPQLNGLGRSYTAQYYAIPNIETARQYIQHPVLKERLVTIAQAVYDLDASNIVDVFGFPDDSKFQSCMTLFHLAAPEAPIFQMNLTRYFSGKFCSHTISHM